MIRLAWDSINNIALTDVSIFFWNWILNIELLLCLENIFNKKPEFVIYSFQTQLWKLLLGSK